MFAFLSLMASMSYGCEKSEMRNLLGVEYSDRSIVERYESQYDTLDLTDFDEMDNCQKYNLALSMKSYDQDMAHYIFCNAGMRGYLPALHNCGWYIQKYKDEKTGVRLLNLSARLGFARSKFVLIKLHMREHGTNTRFAREGLKEIQSEIPEAARLLRGLECYDAGVKYLNECPGL